MFKFIVLKSWGLESVLRKCPFKIDGSSYTYKSVWIASTLSTDEDIFLFSMANKASSLLFYPLMDTEKFSETEFIDRILSGKSRSPIGMSIFNESFVRKELLTTTHYK